MPKTSKPKSPTVCNFCQKHKDAVLKLIIGDNVGICNECVDFCVQILKDTELKKDNINLDPIIIKEYLDCYVIGQMMPRLHCQWQWLIITKDYKLRSKM